ncbi:hypothetical protein H1235_00615 [Pseudoxanthomonas sp. NC8]|nr:hypothetical protein H1235_00615 [Pseudoxanthomonas sp. NC8]
MLKIDVEGAELAALRGARGPARTARRDRLRELGMEAKGSR